MLPRLILLAVLLLPASALAGTVGAFGGAGLHFGKSLTEGGGNTGWVSPGGGVEFLLGTQGGRMHGRLRGFYQSVLGFDGTVQHVGVLSAGVQVELLPQLDQVFGLYVTVDAGVSPLVQHLRVHVFAAVGPGVRFQFHERVGAFVELAGQLRFEKEPAGGPLLNAGVRFTLD